MLIHPLAERLRGLGMAAMADAFLEMQTNSAAAELSREDWLGLLIDREATATTSVSADGSVRPGCVRPRWWKTPTSVHRASSSAERLPALSAAWFARRMRDKGPDLDGWSDKHLMPLWPLLRWRSISAQRAGADRRTSAYCNLDLRKTQDIAYSFPSQVALRFQIEL